MRRGRVTTGPQRLCCWLGSVLLLGLQTGPLAFDAQGVVVINEIHFNPDVKTEPVEFIELFNAGSNTVDLSAWRFSEGVNFTFPQSTQLPAGGYLVVAQDPLALQSKFGASALGPWTGTLNNNGDKIVLRDAAGNVADEVDYQLGFP
jgi:hypothetical protein